MEIIGKISFTPINKLNILSCIEFYKIRDSLAAPRAVRKFRMSPKSFKEDKA
jgi:hypothetical protein